MKVKTKQLLELEPALSNMDPYVVGLLVQTSENIQRKEQEVDSDSEELQI